MGAAAAAARAGAYGSSHFAPAISAPTQPFTYTLGRVGGFRYNPSYANPYAYSNPYIYHPYTNPLHVPFAHAF